jgi:hypothetical protein
MREKMLNVMFDFIQGRVAIGDRFPGHCYCAMEYYDVAMEMEALYM